MSKIDEIFNRVHEKTVLELQKIYNDYFGIHYSTEEISISLNKYYEDRFKHDKKKLIEGDKSKEIPKGLINRKI